MTRQELLATAKAMVAPSKGLLAMDESNRTCNQRFKDVGIAPTEENRRALAGARCKCESRAGRFALSSEVQSGGAGGQV